LPYSSQGECLSIGVKAHVLRSRLLSEDDYWCLLGSDTVREVGQKLCATAYDESIRTMPAEPHRQDLESAIKTTVLKQAENFLIHMSSPRDVFFRAMMSSHEAENLKSVFRFIASGRSDRDEFRRRLYSAKSSKLSYDNVLSARDFSELSDALRGTRFFRVLAEPLKKLHSGEEQRLFPLEAALDMFVELSLFRALKKMPRADWTLLMPIFGARVDLFNLYILHRSMRFYDMTPEEILNRTLPARWRVTLDFLREAARADGHERMAEMTRSRYPGYGRLLSDAAEDPEPELALERNIKRHVWERAARVFNEGLPGFHTAVSYFTLKEFEITDIVRIIEYVRYGYDRRHAAAYLTRPIISGGETEWQL
jgi:V/A-type H+-transporting ATPase subunit C